MKRHKHHFKIALALAVSAGAWGIYWLPQRYLEAGGLTGGWGTIAQMIIGVLLLLPIAIWRGLKKKDTGFELPVTGFLVGGGFICYALSFLLTDVIRALILFYMTPIWTTIFEIMFLKKKPGWQRAVTLTLALTGLWIVFSKNTILPLPENAGDWIALIGGAMFAGGMIRLEIVKTDGVFPIIFCVSNSIAPVPEASICKLVFEDAVVIVLSVIVIPPSISNVPVTFAPLRCTLNDSVRLAPSNVWNINSFAVPLVPSNKILAPDVPAEPIKSTPGTLALFVL